MKILTTDKLSCNILADLLIAHGISLVIASPGSRNVPLLIALSRRKELKVEIVVDERSAAFIALGAAIRSGKPVAICCTSGSALLNYAPAVAEAYYRNVPLIVISADRPVEWIDQDDSQTIRQPGCLTNIVKSQCDIPSDLSYRPVYRMACREINDSLAIALSPSRGPVHINIRIDAPLNRETEYEAGSAPVIRTTGLHPSVSEVVINEAAETISFTPKVLIVAGFMSPDKTLNDALERIVKLSGAVVLTETIANLYSPVFIPAIDLTLNQILHSGEEYRYKPLLVITMGGALVSRKIKEFLRSLDDVTHWHVGEREHFVDCFMNLDLAVKTSPATFFSKVADVLDSADKVSSPEFLSIWHAAYASGLIHMKERLSTESWTDMKAFDILLDNLPDDSEIHFSNGTPIRYSQLFGFRHFARVECNRGVSGIDGCTSTALGASLASGRNIILISGDMSFQYDLAALSSRLLSPRLKMIVLNNSGGGIFRFISATSGLPERETFFSDCMNLPIKGIADAYGIKFIEAGNEAELRDAMPRFLEEKDKAVILSVNTPAVESAESLKLYFEARKSSAARSFSIVPISCHPYTPSGVYALILTSSARAK